MISPGSSAASRSAGSNLGAALLTFLTQPANSNHDNIRVELMGTLLLSRATVLFGAISLTVLLCAMAVLHDFWRAGFVGIVFVVAAASRLRVIHEFTGKAIDLPAAARIIVSGLLYSAAISIVGVTAALSGEPVLVVLGALVMTGMVFGFCISNCGAPHYAQIQALVVTLPFLLAAALSGPPAMLLVLLQAPFWLFGLFGLIQTAHVRLADLVQAQRQNQYLAYNDALTGLANRARVMSKLAGFAGERASTHPSYVLYLDLDGFKSVNDTHGHAMGDLLLRLVAQRLTSCVRASDVVGRMGGDEFIVILRDLAPGEIEILARRLTEEISRPFLPAPDIEVIVGVSIGGAPLGRDPEESIAKADQMLYAAKRNGRGTFRLAGV